MITNKKRHLILTLDVHIRKDIRGQLLLRLKSSQQLEKTAQKT